MCKIIAITNQKGGCSKTTSTVNIGIGLARAGKSVLLIDADAQGSLTASLGFKRPDEIGITLATIMAKTINEEDISEDKLSKYFPPFYSQLDMENIMIELLEEWKKKQGEK